MAGKPYFGGAHHIGGDSDPSNAGFSFTSEAAELLKMYYRNEFVQIMIDWMGSEAYRNWIKFIEDTAPKTATKFGKTYIFKGYEFLDEETGITHVLSPFNEYLQWNDVPINWEMGVAWSRLYDEGSLLVFLDDDNELLKVANKTDGSKEYKWTANSNKQGYTRFTVFQPLEVGSGTGFCVHSSNADGTVKEWKVEMKTENMDNNKVFIIEGGRCIHLLWKKRENGWKACSRVAPLLPTARMEEQTFQKLLKRAHDVAGGILHISGISSQTEQNKLDAAMGDDLTSVDRVYTKEGRLIEYKTPDLKASGEFAVIFELYTKKLIRFMRITQQTLDGEKQGAGLGGNTDNDVMTSYTEIYAIQEHYRNHLEKVFYKLGKENTSFIYREVLPEDMRAQGDGDGDGDDPDGSKTDKNNPKKSKGSAGGKSKQQSGSSNSKSGEQTR